MKKNVRRFCSKIAPWKCKAVFKGEKHETKNAHDMPLFTGQHTPTGCPKRWLLQETRNWFQSHQKLFLWRYDSIHANAAQPIDSDKFKPYLQLQLQNAYQIGLYSAAGKDSSAGVQLLIQMLYRCCTSSKEISRIQTSRLWWKWCESAQKSAGHGNIVPSKSHCEKL